MVRGGCDGHSLVVPKRVWQRLSAAGGEFSLESSVWSALAPFDLTKLVQLLLAALRKSLGRKDLALILSDPEDRVFRVRARCGYRDRDLSPVQFAQDSPVIRHFAAHAVPTYYTQLERLPWLKVISRQEREALASLERMPFLPLSAQGRLVGLLVFGKSKPGKMRRRKVSLAPSDCCRLATIIEEAQLYHQLKKEHLWSDPTHRQPQQLEQTAKGIAHDLNNILTTIISHAQLLEDEDESGEAGRHTVAIRQAVLDGAEAVNRIRDLMEHTEDPEPRTVELNDIIRTTLQMIEPRWRQGRISYSSAVGGRALHAAPLEAATASEGHFVPPPHLSVTLRPAGHVRGSPAELRRVLTNIISNAVDALPWEQGRIEITSGRDGQWATMSVRDNGAGISPETKERIFEPLFTTKGQRGNGLGLTISRTIVARYGGRLEVESEEGRGSTFTVLLPLTSSNEGYPS